MNEATMAALVLFLGGALPAYLFAYAIGVRQAVHLIAGWHENKVTNAKAYAQVIGASLFVMAIGMTLAALLLWAQMISGNELLVLLLSASTLPVIGAVYGWLKYRPRN
ncbi:hypothetical protein [Bowmanella dokdonensis]|uniref:DUF3784 domain-containing protein n=1 Tax=Bowmanella dokdonensis TaxID=751969 RepID=A0A939DNT3_9ALTE|nr:hypothetical protein [Bowmanella dokdonensis]MBN7826010.1 hypothetical protein [Bowmanella dokdonensis]